MNRHIKTISFALVTILYTGCGTSVDSENRHVVHKITKTNKALSAVNGTLELHANFSNNTHHFSIKSKDSIANANAQILIDTDQNNNTGYRVKSLDRKIIGIEYILENGTLYKFTGTSQDQWSWKYIKNYGNASASQVTDALNNSTKMDIIGAFYDKSWKTTVRTAKYTYTPVESNDNGNQALSPKEIIQNQIGKYRHLSEFVYTPAKQGAAVIIYSDTNTPSLYLYGLENPTNPVREYTIAQGADPEDVIKDIKMLGDGKLQYTIFNKTHADQKEIVVYDYFNKQEITTKNNLMTYIYTEDNSKIIAITKDMDNRGKIKFYTLNADNLDIENEFSDNFYLYNTTINKEDFTVKDNGDIKVDFDFATFNFNYQTNRGNYAFKKDVQPTNDYDDMLEDVLYNLRGDEHDGVMNYSAIKADDNTLIVEVKFLHSHKLFSIDLTHDNKALLLTTLAKSNSFEPYFVDKTNHFLIYREQSTSFDQYISYTKINYIDKKEKSTLAFRAGLGG